MNEQEDDQVVVESDSGSLNSPAKNSEKKNSLFGSDHNSPKSNPKSDESGEEEENDDSKTKSKRRFYLYCRRRKAERNVYTISDIELTDVTEAE